jgi:hypothetical protein
MSKKSQHGGRREGAGRKVSNPEGPTKIVAASVPASLVDQLDEEASKRGWNRSEAITEAIRRLLALALR